MLVPITFEIVTDMRDDTVLVPALTKHLSVVSAVHAEVVHWVLAIEAVKVASDPAKFIPKRERVVPPEVAALPEPSTSLMSGPS